MLPLVTSDHIDWLLKQIEIEVLVAGRWSYIKISINISLCACIEKRVNVTLVPAGLFDWLKFRV